jgi:hypothetical protein
MRPQVNAHKLAGLEHQKTRLREGRVGILERSQAWHAARQRMADLEARRSRLAANLKTLRMVAREKTRQARLVKKLRSGGVAACYVSACIVDGAGVDDDSAAAGVKSAIGERTSASRANACQPLTGPGRPITGSR